MNSDTVKVTWKQFKGKLKEAWGDLTDDDLDKYEGKREQLVGALQKKYGQAKDEIESRLSGYERDANYDYRPVQPRYTRVYTSTLRSRPKQRLARPQGFFMRG